MKAACDAYLDSISMNNRQVAHESRPAPGARRWVRKKADAAPASSLKPDWPAIVREGIKAGIIQRPSKP
jgi:hypothetical protein